MDCAAMATVEDCDKGSVALSHFASSKLLLGIGGQLLFSAIRMCQRTNQRALHLEKLHSAKINKRNKSCSMINFKCYLNQGIEQGKS